MTSTLSLLLALTLPAGTARQAPAVAPGPCEGGLDAFRCAAALAAPGASLGGALGNPDPHVRAIAAAALVSADATPGLDLLSRLARDPYPGVRTAAALGLGRLGRDGAPFLLRLLGDRAERVRSAAAGQLVELLSDAELASVVEGRIGDEAVREQLLPALPRLPARTAVAVLVATVRHARGTERLEALGDLAHYGDPRAYDAVAAIAAADPDPVARDLARRLLGE